MCSVKRNTTGMYYSEYFINRSNLILRSNHYD
nr:MAG TPA: hypothetical protein [Caudoviricetes sp.]